MNITTVITRPQSSAQQRFLEFGPQERDPGREGNIGLNLYTLNL